MQFLGHADSRSVSNRPRAKSNASSRSITRTAPSRSFRNNHASDDSDHTPNRSRAHSNASSTGKSKEKRSMIPSFRSFGKKGGIGVTARKSFTQEKYGNIEEDDGRQALHSDGEDNLGSGRKEEIGFRDSLAYEPDLNPPKMRRTHTTALTATTYVKAIYNFAGAGADELSLRAEQVVEVKKKVSEDWYLGECEGRSGLFPSSYCEEYVPSPVTPALPPIPRRSLPPRSHSSTQTMAPSPTLDLTSDSEPSHGFSDSDLYDTASLAAVPSSRSKPVKKPAPPPPPSRRSASSNNIPTAHTAYLSPPQPVTRPRANTASRRPTLDSSPEGLPFAGSPFAGSDDDEFLHGGTIPGPSGLSHGLAGVQLQEDTSSQASCRVCSCDDFTQNVFKAKGMCSTCYHQH